MNVSTVLEESKNVPEAEFQKPVTDYKKILRFIIAQ